MDTGTVAFLLPLSGLLAGVVLGFTARRNFFCTLSALEQYWYANNSTGVRTWVFAATIAAIFTQILVVFGLFEPASSCRRAVFRFWHGTYWHVRLWRVGSVGRRQSQKPDGCSCAWHHRIVGDQGITGAGSCELF